MEHEQRIRDLLNLGNRARLVEIGVFTAPESGPFEEDTLADVERELPGDGREQLLAEETLATVAIEDALSPDPDLSDLLPVDQALRSDLDARILVLEGVPDTAVADGAAEEREPGTWLLDTRGEQPVVLFVGDHEGGVALWGRNGELRVYLITFTAGR